MALAHILLSLTEVREIDTSICVELSTDRVLLVGYTMFDFLPLTFCKSYTHLIVVASS
jgi:hypothetical protein